MERIPLEDSRKIKRWMGRHVVYLAEPRAQSGSLALPRMPTVGCQLDRGPEAPAPSQGSAPVAARLCRPVGLWLLPRVGASGCVSGRLGALGKGVRVSQPARARVSECPAEGLAPAPSACATCTGAQATPVQGRARTCRGHGHPRPYRGPHLPPLAPAGLPSVCGRRPLPLSRRESPPPGLPLLGRRPRPAPGRPASRAGGDSGCDWPPSGAAARAPRHFPCPATPRLHSSPFPCPRGPAQWRGRCSLGLRSSGCKAQLLLAETWEKRAPTLSMLLSPPSVFLPQGACGNTRGFVPAGRDASGLPGPSPFVLELLRSVNDFLWLGGKVV
ncbi:skin secretory protein xP2-like isoform X2 [Camelus ferus]|uniref:Skin secretory protein xP2-like isoform X2 n=1 Tax=Camelus ferus TaxID=419612 RepID=A0A8B8SNK3_CAMFR|nr:skin secretory protein xP2-like isoform X2 [Camelus ferus]